MTLTANLQTPDARTASVAPAGGGILVATDGTPDADGAVRVGLALSRRAGVPMTMLSIVEPLAASDTDSFASGIAGVSPISAADIDNLNAVSRELRESAIEAQHERTHPGIHEWPYVIEVGERVSGIRAKAEREQASLIILGLGAHGVAARLLRRETAVRVIRASSVPVLAVPTHAWGVPHSALAAIDFTPSSEDAARAALGLLGGEGTLYLAHVSPRVPIPQGDPRSWEELATAGVVPRLEAVAGRLAPPPGVRVEYVTLHGEPTHELLAFAEQFGVDMIAAGAHGRSALGRLVLGSVSTKLVRTAQCWVLVAPPRPEAPAVEGAGSDH